MGASAMIRELNLFCFSYSSLDDESGIPPCNKKKKKNGKNEGKGK